MPQPPSILRIMIVYFNTKSRCISQTEAITSGKMTIINIDQLREPQHELEKGLGVHPGLIIVRFPIR